MKKVIALGMSAAVLSKLSEEHLVVTDKEIDEKRKAFEKKLEEDRRRQEREEKRAFRLNGDMGRKGKGERKRTRGDWSSMHGRQGFRGW